MPKASVSYLKKTLIQIGKLLYQKNFVSAAEGNMSFRLDENRILVTPSGLCKGFLKEKELVVVDKAGKKVSGFLSPSSELKMHLAVYERRKDVNAVVHAHPPYATALAVAGESLENYFLPEGVLSLGPVPLTDYATPTTAEVPQAISRLIGKANALLLKNHGVIACGKDLWEAYFRMEMVEKVSQIYWLAKALGKIDYLKPEEIAKLEMVRQAHHPVVKAASAHA